MLELGIGGNMYKIIKNMYMKFNLRIKTLEGLSHLIKSNNGVRQGDGLSPILFNIFINELPLQFLNEDCISPKLNEEPIPCLLYADDLVILSETADGMQACLNRLDNYCKTWRLNLNFNKTKIMIMRSRGPAPKLHFSFQGQDLQITNSYKYLGTIINSNGTFNLAREELKNKGLKAMFSMWKSISTGNTPIGIATKLFDAMVKPIIIYNSDVWGSEIPKTLQKHILGHEITKYDDKYLKYINECPYEKLHLKFCKMLLRVQKQTSNIGTRAEIGRFPIIIDTYIAMIKYWIRLNNLPDDRVVKDALNANNIMQEKGIYTWTSMIKYILDITGYSSIWRKKMVTNTDKFIEDLRFKLNKNYKELTNRVMFDDNRQNGKGNNKLRTYRKFKNDHKQEIYLKEIKNWHIRSAVAKMRLSNHHLMIEKGRHLGLDLEKRTCNKCNLNQIETEFHAIMTCPAYHNDRTELFRQFDNHVTTWKDMTSENKFIHIMKMNTLIIMTGQFISNIVNFDQAGNKT